MSQQEPPEIEAAKRAYRIDWGRKTRRLDELKKLRTKDLIANIEEKRRAQDDN